MKKNLVLFALFTLNTAMAAKVELSGNLEIQARHSKNNPEAKDLAQDWNDENFYLGYGNLNAKYSFSDSRIEANWFTRYAQSKLYQAPAPQDHYIATDVFMFPNKLVARDVLKLTHKEFARDHYVESVINKLYYEWDYEDHRFMIGRMYINYGLGEIFNPMNPFNQPTGLTSISQVAQGNDGLSFTFFVDDQHTMQFLILGDKSYHEYDGRVTRTLWLRGEYQYSDRLQLDYAFGEDQERQKIGGQASYRFDEAMVFSQVFYQTENVKNKDDSTHLWDVLIGYDQQLTSKWHIRFEGGHQKKDPYATALNFNGRFLPSEYFAAIANVYEIHPLVNLHGTIINDVKTGFTYAIAKATFSLKANIEAEIFGYIPAAKGKTDDDNLAQKLVTTDVGLALRAFF